jgi:hypothetical protein
MDVALVGQFDGAAGGRLGNDIAVLLRRTLVMLQDRIPDQQIPTFIMRLFAAILVVWTGSWLKMSG